MTVKLRINPIAWADRRTPEQRRHADNIEQARWRWRVVENVKRRTRSKS